MAPMRKTASKERRETFSRNGTAPYVAAQSTAPSGSPTSKPGKSRDFRATFRVSRSHRKGASSAGPRQCFVAEIKLPAAQVLGPAARRIPESPLSVEDPIDHLTFREITYTEEDGVGYLGFDFYNGAMSTEQCYRLRDAFLYARRRPTKVIALLGGRDFWSNGIHLNVIEAAADPAQEASWRNINAIDDLIYETSTRCRIS